MRLVFPAVVALALLASVLAAVPATATPPAGAEARYVMSAQGLDIAQIRWRMSSGDNGERIYESVSESIGVARVLRNERVIERTRWRLDGGRVQPLEYTYSRRGGKRRRDASVRFDWPRASALNTINGDNWTLALTPGFQDKLSYLLALMNHLERGEHLDQVQVTDGGKSKTYHFRYLGDASLDTVLGRLDTVRVRREVEGDERVTTVWMAPSLGHFPVRIEHTEDGKSVSIVLDALEGISPR